MTSDELHDHVVRAMELWNGLAGHAHDGVRVARALNWGGFTNAHFVISAGTRRYHLKLADDAASAAELRRWQRLADRLEGQYRAPKIVDWIALPGTPHAGLLFEQISGTAPSLVEQPAFVDDVVALLRRLHGDSSLAKVLADEGLASDPRGSVLGHYVETLETDLRECGDRYPVSADLLGWMEREVAVVRRLIENATVFDQAPGVPIHGDLWQQNLLVTKDQNWFVLDWDGLSLGDAALDHAVLLLPHVQAGRDLTRWTAGLDPDFATRFDLCVRAGRLDEVVDPLADWVEAEVSPQHMDEVRARKMEIHLRALAQYRAAYR
jgi:aminoglycoside phosphotransferase (APT) family kinase protein